MFLEVRKMEKRRKEYQGCGSIGNYIFADKDNEGRKYLRNYARKFPRNEVFTGTMKRTPHKKAACDFSTLVITWRSENRNWPYCVS